MGSTDLTRKLLEQIPTIPITPAYVGDLIIARSLQVTRVAGQRRRLRKIAVSIVTSKLLIGLRVWTIPSAFWQALRLSKDRREIQTRTQVF